MADLRTQLLAAFALEHREHVDAMRDALVRARQGEAIDIREVFRRAHSLKGAARAVDLPKVESLAHELESVFSGAMESAAGLSSAALEQALRTLSEIEAAAAPGPSPEPSKAPSAEIDSAATAPTHFLRVDGAQMRSLESAMHDLSAELDAADRTAMRETLTRVSQLARRLETAQAEATRDHAKAVRALGDAAHEMRALSREITALARQHETERWSVDQAAARLRENIAQVAMAPASEVFAGLDPMVREMSAAAGLDVEFVVQGMETLADRKMMQSLRDPVIQLLRNAIAHGVEPPGVRRAAGKPERATVGLALAASGGRLMIRVFDDGRGPDLERIEAAARRRGLISGALPPAPEALLALVFEAGVSTNEEVDAVAGRGMGLSVVSEAVRRANGSVLMRQRRPHGAETLISAPLSAARQTLVMLRQGEDVYALPAFAIEQVLDAAAQRLETLDGRTVVRAERDGNQIVVPIVSLGQLTGAAAEPEAGRTLNIAVLCQDELRLGLWADAVEDVRALTLTPLEGEISDIVAGAAQLERGEIAIVLKPDAILQRHLRGQLGGWTPTSRASEAANAKTILIVDDSVTTRTLEKSILEAQGYRVVLAVDGLDALSVLRSGAHLVDLIVADIEMPRMDGFQLLQALKGDTALAAVPIIMMTSRAEPDDVRRGLELGANAYLVKQSFDQRELVSTIRQLL